MVQQAAACAAPSPKARGREPRSGKEARPIVGGLVRVRGREAVVLAVRPWLAPPQPGSSLVSIEYTDRQEPGGDSLLWELEQNRSAAGNDLPDVALKAPMAPIPFRSMVRAAIWTSPGIGGPQPPAGQAGPGAAALLSLAACAVEAKGYQLVPVSKALEMPRVRLLLADDVGLGKTIEAGFIMAELLIRRRIRKILVLCPPSLCRQWQRELAGKFGLDFRVMDRRLACEVRGRLGPETSPWECFDALIASYHYLAQPAILEEFRRGCHAGGRPHLPWDLLVVDEAHNLMPRPAGRESRLTATLKAISPWFEHRVFLTATPHDGFTSSFTGLLEILEPLSFRRSCAPTPEETARFSRTIVRHTRREIERGSLPGRRLVALEVSFSPLERELLAAFKSFQSTIRRWGKVSHSGRGTAAAFVLEVLGKRLLSSTVAFALSFASFRQGLAGGLNPDEQVLDSLAWAMRSRLPAGREQEGAWLEAARVIGAWLNRYFPSAGAKVERIVRALLRLGLDPAAGTGPVPVEDSRFERLLAWMGEHLLSKGRWLADERVILFTEYVATLDYLAARLKARFPGDAERFAAMSGSMREAERRRLVERFNDPTCPLRVLLTTDVAAEGLNLQSCCRYVFHQDIPWNPSVLEQRVGRVHRTGQTREVRAFHFTSGEAEEFRFLSRVADKVERIRGDLGQTADVLAASVQAVLAKGERSRPLLPAASRPLAGSRPRAWPEPDLRQIERLEAQLFFRPEEKRETLEQARFCGPLPTSLDCAPTSPPGEGLGASPAKPEGRSRAGGCEQPRIHLLHPLVRWSAGRLAALTIADRVDRWCVLRCPLPEGWQAVLLVFLRILAENGLGQQVVCRVETVAMPVSLGEGAWQPGPPLTAPLPCGGSAVARPRYGEWPNSSLGEAGDPAGKDPVTTLVERFLRVCDVVPGSDGDVAAARTLFRQCRSRLGRFLDALVRQERRRIVAALETERSSEEKRVAGAIAQRRRELDQIYRPGRMKHLQRRVGSLEAECRSQGFLLPGLAERTRAEISALGEELREVERRRAELLASLQAEEEWLLNRAIPAAARLARPPALSVVGVAVVLSPGIAFEPESRRRP